MQYCDYAGNRLTYGYEKDGNRSFMQYPDGQKVIYHRDEIGRVKAITCGTYEKTYRYDTTGRLCSTRMGKDLFGQYRYDTNGNLVEILHTINGTALEHIQYQYDETGTIISQTRKSRDPAYDYVREPQYDALGRIIAIKEGDHHKEYRYDGEVTEPKNGNDVLLNARNLPHTFAVDGETLQTNTYDSFANRIGMVENGSNIEHHYLIDYARNIPRIVADNRKVTKATSQDANLQEENQFLWNENEWIGELKQGLYVLSDAMGTPLQVVDENGNSVNRYQYDIYGKVEQEEEQIPLPFGFAGHVRELDDSYYFAGAREYDARKGRFLSRDALSYLKKADPCGVNLYQYGNGNPLRYVDYNGHESITEYLTLQETMERDGYDRMAGCIHRIDLDDWKMDIQNFDYRSLDSYINITANIVSMASPYTAPLRYLTPDYFKRSAKQVILGNFTDECTLLGTGASVAIGLTGLDIYLDIRDLTADFTVNFNPKSLGWWGNVALDAIGVLPIAGAIKNGKGFVKGAKKAGNLIDEGADAAKKLAKLNLPDIHLKPIEKLADNIDEGVDAAKNVLKLDAPNIKQLDSTIDDLGDVVKTSYGQSSGSFAYQTSYGKSSGSFAYQSGTTTIRYKEVKTFTAEETNQWFIDNVKPDYKPPYKPGTMVKEIELTEKTTFVRVYDNMPEGSGMYGSWVMKAEDIEGLTLIEIKNKFALPNTPIYVCDVELEAGTHIRVGEVNPLEGWGSGGGTQYDLIGQRIGSFINERLLEDI